MRGVKVAEEGHDRVPCAKHYFGDSKMGKK